MKAALLIGLGGFLGANARYLVSVWTARHIDPALPWGTLVVNVTGSLVIGVFLAWTTEWVLADPALRFLLAVGFCGSYTTFSSYAFETVVLLEEGHLWAAAGNFLLNNVVSILAVVAGIALARWI